MHHRAYAWVYKSSSAVVCAAAGPMASFAMVCATVSTIIGLLLRLVMAIYKCVSRGCIYITQEALISSLRVWQGPAGSAPALQVSHCWHQWLVSERGEGSVQQLSDSLLSACVDCNIDRES